MNFLTECIFPQLPASSQSKRIALFHTHSKKILSVSLLFHLAPSFHVNFRIVKHTVIPAHWYFTILICSKALNFIIYFPIWCMGFLQLTDVHLIEPPSEQISFLPLVFM